MRAVELSNRAGLQFSLPVDEDQRGERAVEWLQAASGWLRLRPRALLTTMFARLFLGDLFIHGIGGAAYDGLTDVLIRRFFGHDPPGFMVVTATAKLPIARHSFRAADLQRVQQRLRDLTYHPEKHAADSASAALLVDAKNDWIRREGPSRRQRHHEIVRINEALQPFVAEQREMLLVQRAELEEHAQRERVLGSREYSFALFPRETLQPLLLDI
jgi:hypothetical protein